MCIIFAKLKVEKISLRKYFRGSLYVDVLNRLSVVGNNIQRFKVTRQPQECVDFVFRICGFEPNVPDTQPVEFEQQICQAWFVAIDDAFALVSGNEHLVRSAVCGNVLERIHLDPRLQLVSSARQHTQMGLK